MQPNLKVSNPPPLEPTERMREELAESLGLERGNIPNIPSDAPANSHYYFFNEVIDPETEEIEVTQYINFEDRLEGAIEMLLAKRREWVGEALERVRHSVNNCPHSDGEARCCVIPMINEINAELEGGKE